MRGDNGNGLTVMEALRFPLRVQSSRPIPAVRSGPSRCRRRTGYQSSSPSPETYSPVSAEVAAEICFRPPLIVQERPGRMSCSGAWRPLPVADGGHAELNIESDFDALQSPDGYIYICGFGSLLSEKSARSTFPELRDFRVAMLPGFRRVFGHTAPVFFERGIANVETREMSSLSVEPCEGEVLVVTVFEIRKSEIPSFIEREHEFRFLAVIPEELNGSSYNRPAVLCARYSDEEYFRVRCNGSMDIYFQRYGRYNIQSIWRNDILPCRVYLRHCVLAAKNLGQEAYDNFLDHTYIADRVTTIRKYLLSTGSGIMEEEPPESLRHRYGG